MNSDFHVLLPQENRGANFGMVGGTLLNWVLNGGRIHLVEAYNNRVKRRGSITFSEKIGNRVEK